MSDVFRLPIAGAVENDFARLGGAFFTHLPGEKVGGQPQLLHANPGAAALIDLDPAVFSDPRFAAAMAGHLPLEGFESLAQVYSGHQFGVWAGQLGDGRALLIGQVRNRKGELWDIQLKGAGKTPYSRFGDGRAVLRSSIREYLCSEAMAALRIPTSRALSLVATGETVLREKPEPGAVIARLAQSHVRFGHFEHFHYAGNTEAVRALADHVIAEHFPDLDYADFYAEVVRRTAVLMAHWQAVGFAHGVMNTDNMSILGLTLDYGPFGFMDSYDPEFICNHSDEQGRYSVINQPGIAQWNLRALAVALSRIVPAQTLLEALDGFERHFGARYRSLMRAKLGLGREEEGDDRLIGELLALMAKGRADYTLTFRELPRAKEGWLNRFGGARAEATHWLERWRARVADEELSGLDRVNPKYVLRNWVAETAIRAVQDRGDVAALDRIFKLLQAPYDEHPKMEEFAAPPPAAMCGLEVSCSS
ncbi:MAG: YdiU family protein [Alphaproteobacteria bacterium]|nr:YdiU family protein [Alphaproteobacteria bacterium]